MQTPHPIKVGPDDPNAAVPERQMNLMAKQATAPPPPPGEYHVCLGRRVLQRFMSLIDAKEYVDGVPTLSLSIVFQGMSPVDSMVLKGNIQVACVDGKAYVVNNGLSGR